MPTKKSEPSTVEKFERALRKALNTPPQAPRKTAKKKRREKPGR